MRISSLKPLPGLKKPNPFPTPMKISTGTPPRPPAPDPFEEFEVDRRPVSSLMDDLPSLDGLFKPFDLESETPAAEEGFEELYSPGPPQDYVFEDLDTRDPNIINTLIKAEAKRDEIIRAAEEEADRLRRGVETEIKGQMAELEARRQTLLEEARREAEELQASVRQAAAEDRQAAEKERLEMENQRAAAERSRLEAEGQLAAAAERIAGLDGEREKMEAEMAARQSEMEAEHSRKMTELEDSRAGLFEEARSSGYEEGRAQGLAEGRESGRAEAAREFQDKVEGLVAILEKMESIYDGLWQANGPMMIELAIEGAQQILNKELGERRDLAARAFEAAIDYLSQAHQVDLMVNPREVAALEEARAEQRQRLGALVSVRIKPDESLRPGDLIVEADVGRLDATIKHRSAQVLDALREAFAGNFQDRPEKYRVEVLSPRPETEAASPADSAPEEPVLEGEFEEGPAAGAEPEAPASPPSAPDQNSEATEPAADPGPVSPDSSEIPAGPDQPLNPGEPHE